MYCAIWNRESVAMPLKDFFAVSKVAEQRVAPAFCGGFDVVPADFLDGICRDLGTERAGQQLSAEADTKYRLACRDGFADGRDLNGQMRMVVYLIAVHRTAKHDQAMIATEIRYRIGLSPEILVPDAKAGIPQQGIEGAEYLVRDVLKNKQAMHRCPGL